MHVSIWQQFSSNHSSNFTLVGEFESAEWANTVADEMRDMLRIIIAWWQQFEESEEQSAKEKELLSRGELTPPELGYKSAYQVDWPRIRGKERSLDWTQSEAALEAVVVYQNLVFIEPVIQTWMGPIPFKEIFQKLGGKTSAWHEDHTELHMTIECTAPDEATAIQMLQSVSHPSDKPSFYVVLRIPGFYSSAYFSYDGGEVTRNGLRVTYQQLDLRLGRDQDKELLERTEVFMKLIRYLQDLGCTGIRCSFQETAS